MIDAPMRLIATSGFGLEAVVRRELAKLDIESEVVSPGRIGFWGSAQTLCRALIWLRTADRILIELASFDCSDFDTLFETAGQIDWRTWAFDDAAINVTGRSVKSQLTSVPAVQRTVKKAIVGSMLRDGAGELPETGSEFKVDCALLNDRASLTIDAAGRGLHARGYRTKISDAPIKETLAAALVQLSYWQNGRPLLDPFCGSGTIVIEAAMIGRNIAPGVLRLDAAASMGNGAAFAIETLRNFDNDVFAGVVADARSVALPTLDVRIGGGDIATRSLDAARENATRAGVAEDVFFERRDFHETRSKARFGCVITNPPYGQRIGASSEFQSRAQRDGTPRNRNPPDRDERPTRYHDAELDRLYGDLPDLFRRLPTWSHYVLTAYPQFERLVDRRADRRRKLYNARIQCTYYQYHGPKPVREEVADAAYVHADGEAAFGQLDDRADGQAEVFAARLRKRARHLRKWPTKRDIHCVRIYERDVPEIPLVIDRYEDHLHVTEYERPHDRDAATHANWLDRMTAVAADTLQIPRGNTHLKSRRRQRGTTQHERVGQSGQRIAVREGGLKFWINLEDYVDTGLFLDHRQTRSMFRDEAKGRKVLNLFCYTGAFTVYAADGAAATTTSVDLSATYLDWARDNLKLNGLAGPNHRFFRDDVVAWVDAATRRGERYDLVVLDPPTFSNSKKTLQHWDVNRDAVGLIHRVLEIMAPGGVMFFSTNFRRFKMDESEVNCDSIHEITRQTLPEDFRNRRIHRCWRITR